jgi:hypothetical protein
VTCCFFMCDFRTGTTSGPLYDVSIWECMISRGVRRVSIRWIEVEET